MRADSRRSRRQPAHQDRDEDDVVDAENDLERGQREERYPGVRIGEHLDHGGGLTASASLRASSSMGSLRTVGKTCSAFRPQDSAMALEM